MAIPPQSSVTQNQNVVNDVNIVNDPLYIASSDHPGMVLTNTPFNDLYKGKKAKKSNKLATHVNSGFDEHFHEETPFDVGSENKFGFGQNGGVDKKLAAVVCQEMMKMFKRKNVMEDRNYASTSHAAVTKPHKDKFDNKGIKCVLLGIPQSHIAFLANAFAASDPTSFYQANADAGWMEAIDKELAALESKKTWTLTSLTPGHKLITSKWHEGLDYKHTFSPVAKLATIRVLIALATAKQCPLHQLDVNNAFLHGYIDEEIYMLPPQVALPTAFPLPTELKLSLEKGTTLSDPDAYRRLVGILLYLTMTRPYISYAVQHLSQFVSAPKDAHMQAVMHLLRYLKGTISKVSWKTKKQPTVSGSSTVVEYRAIAATTCGLLLLSYLLQDLHIKVKLPVTLFCDNKAAQQIAVNQCFHDRTKHFEIDCHFIRDKVQDGFLQTTYIPSQLQLVDIMTKALGNVHHSFLTDKFVAPMIFQRWSARPASRVRSAQSGACTWDRIAKPHANRCFDEDMLQELAEDHMDHLKYDKSKSGALIHKNREGSKQEGQRICPTIGDFGGTYASNQSSFINGRIEEWEEE
ncbi:probable carboxylesterase 2 [Tanacetum coccineum]|uniref:Probable carboxylesterase 2 n=1 Tax=Tanacetum coccineum TaxID=301880 RepID=A0ABQ5HXV4_9ASTR